MWSLIVEKLPIPRIIIVELAVYDECTRKYESEKGSGVTQMSILKTAFRVSVHTLVCHVFRENDESDICSLLLFVVFYI